MLASPELGYHPTPTEPRTTPGWANWLAGILVLVGLAAIVLGPLSSWMVTRNAVDHEVLMTGDDWIVYEVDPETGAMELVFVGSEAEVGEYVAEAEAAVAAEQGAGLSNGLEIGLACLAAALLVFVWGRILSGGWRLI